MLQSKDILQIDATVIAGILILLTLVFTSGERIQPTETIERGNILLTLSAFAKTPVAWIYSIGIWFSFSAISATIMNFKENNGDKSRVFWYSKFFSIMFMILGFANLSIGFYLVGNELLFSK